MGCFVRNYSFDLVIRYALFFIEFIVSNVDGEEESVENELNDELGSNDEKPQIMQTRSDYPTLCEVYTDPENLTEKVQLAVALPGGVSNVRVELDELGTKCEIKYAWPKTMFQMDDMFKGPIRSKKITSYHPKILALKLGLQKFRDRVDSVPEGKIEVPLPIQVQTGPQSWSKYGIIRDDGTHVIVAEFSGCVKAQYMKVSDSAVEYEK